jgi:hypothetical protein
MKTQTFKAGNEIVMRITVTGAEIDRHMIGFIGTMGPGLCRAADGNNTRPLFETPDRTYELRVPVELYDTPQTGPPPSAVSG